MEIGAKFTPLIYTPKNLSEALSLLNAHPFSEVYAGGTGRLPDSQDETLRLGKTTLSLHLLEELRKVGLGERSFDLGAGLTLNQVSLAGKNIVDPILRKAVLQIGSQALRNLATLGGNLCQKGHFGDLFPVLYTLGAQFEFKSLRSSRWVAAPAAQDSEALLPQHGELMTRVRLPQETWQKSFYERIGHYRTPWDERLSMVCLAKIKEDVLTQFRLCFFLPQAGLVRDRKMEAELSGQSLPLGPKERQNVLAAIQNAVEALPRAPTAFQRERINQMTRWILPQVQEE